MKILRIILQILGAFFVALMITISGMFLYSVSPLSERVNKATEKQVQFVLNWGGINVKQNYSVVFSYESPHHPLGDHLIYYCLQLSEFSVDELHRDEWKAGPETNPVFSQAIELAASSEKSDECFTHSGRSNSKEVQAFFWSVHTHRRQPSGAQVLLYESSSKRLLYVSYET